MKKLFSLFELAKRDGHDFFYLQWQKK